MSYKNLGINLGGLNLIRKIVLQQPCEKGLSVIDFADIFTLTKNIFRAAKCLTEGRLQHVGFKRLRNPLYMRIKIKYVCIYGRDFQN